MSPPSLSFHISLHDNVDLEELDRLTRQICHEIANLDVEKVELAAGNTLPAGAKGDPITVGSLIVSLASAGVFTALIELLKSWALRREGRNVTIKAEAGEQKIELAFSPAEASEKEMARFAQAIMNALRQEEKPATKG